MNYHFEDFTEYHYRYLLNEAKKRWSFGSFVDYRSADNICLWRHDIDISVHRAYRLAQIEREENVTTTYFVHLHSPFYSIFEASTMQLLNNIKDLGHHIGLHFEPSFFQLERNEEEKLIKWLLWEKKLLEDLLSTTIHVFSFHNPDIGGWESYPTEIVADMINTYSSYFQVHYNYCSDSNGYWRYQRLKDFIQNASSSKIQVLTHPVWWTPESMSPRERVTRCIQGREQFLQEQYNHSLQVHGRANIGTTS